MMDKKRIFSCFMIIVIIMNMIPVYEKQAIATGDIVAIAKAEVGVSGVPNKYTYWLGSIGEMGYNYPWCQAFASWCAYQAGQDAPKTASCANAATWFNERNRWKVRSSGYVPQPGDFIYFDWNNNGGYDHVGIVNYTSNGRVYTIEGNAKNAVKYNGGYSNGYSISDTQIIGYGIMNASTVPDTDSCTCSEELAGNYIVNTDSLDLNIRNGHGTNSAIVGTIPKGTKIYVSKANSEWGHVSYAGIEGYVSMNYLRREESSGERPIGDIDEVTGIVNGITVRGWALDRDDVSQSLSIHVYIGGPAGSGAPGYPILANKERTDVANAYPGVGNYHGYEETILTDRTGKQDVYFYAINIGGGDDHTLLGIRTVTINSAEDLPVTGKNPLGNLEVITANEGIIHLEGWAFDEDDSSQSLKIAVCIGGPMGSQSSGYYILADSSRSDVSATYPGVGENHGFHWSICVKERGVQDVYVYAKNIGGGEDTFLGCKSVNITEEIVEKKIKPGIYTIATALDKNKVMDIYEMNMDDGTPLIICDANGGTNQKFKIEIIGEGMYTISPLHSGKKLQVVNGERLSDVVQNIASDVEGQKWQIRSAGDGSYFIVSEYGKRFLDMQNANTTNNTKIITNFGNGTTAQRWLFRRLVEGVDIKLEDGTSANNILLNEIGGQYTLSAQVTPAEVFDKNVRWESSDTAVVKVDGNGRITAMGNGSAIVKAITHDGGFMDYCLVKVNSSQIIYGDLNLDGKITATDLSVLNKAINGSITLSEKEQVMADLDGDGMVNNDDLDIMQAFISGKMAEFPVESLLSEIVITKTANKTTFIQDEPFSSEGLEVTAYYNNGNKKVITDYSISGNTSLLGEQVVNVSYSENNRTKSTLYFIQVSQYCDLNGHDYELAWTVDKEATCVEPGSQSRHCHRCQAKIDITAIEPLNHTWIYGRLEVEASCEQKGQQTYTCTNCKQSKTEVIEALGHDFDKEWIVDKEATCIEAGSKSRHCSRCDVKTDVTIINQNSHKWKESLVLEEASCAYEGLLEYQCQYCAEAKTQKIPKVNHEYEKVVEQASYGTNGCSFYECTSCGERKNKTVIYAPSTIKLSKSIYVYNGNYIRPTVVIKNKKGMKLKESIDYKLVYSSGRKTVGKYTVKVVFRGNYQGTKTLNFTIQPKAAFIRTITAGKKGFTAKWNKINSQVSGYQIQYAKNSSFKAGTTKTATAENGSITQKSVSKLLANTKYYVRIRSYKNVKINGKTVKIYSNWSSAKSVKTK